MVSMAPCRDVLQPADLPAWCHRVHRASWPTLLVVLACLFSRAVSLHIPKPVSQSFGELVLDMRMASSREGMQGLPTVEDSELRRKLRGRQEVSVRVNTPSQLGASATSTGETATSSSSTTMSSAQLPLPSPLDGSLSSSLFSSDGGKTCLNFIRDFVVNDTFKQCYPFSLLLQPGSQSFFETAKSLVAITKTLDTSCRADARACNAHLASIAHNLTESGNCKADYESGNEYVLQIHTALLSYTPVYNAACIRDTEEASYCFAQAITNITNPTNMYVYYLPLDDPLPERTLPTCDACLAQTMNVFHVATANRAQPIARTYPAAAKQINGVCGPGFINETLPFALASNAAPGLSSLSLWLWLLASACAPFAASWI